jgi:hypothetical protein
VDSVGAACRRCHILCKPHMTNENTPESEAATTESAEDFLEQENESIGDYHRMAARHFAAAAKHHLAAATADDNGDDERGALHAHLAYRQQLNGVQCAEIAVMDSETLEDMLDDEGSAA